MAALMPFLLIGGEAGAPVLQRAAMLDAVALGAFDDMMAAMAETSRKSESFEPASTSSGTTRVSIGTIAFMRRPEKRLWNFRRGV